MKKLILVCLVLGTAATAALAEDIAPAIACGGSSGIACPTTVGSGITAVPAIPCGGTGQAACPTPSASAVGDEAPAQRLGALVPADFGEQLKAAYEAVMGVSFDHPPQACESSFVPSDLWLQHCARSSKYQLAQNN